MSQVYKCNRCGRIHSTSNNMAEFDFDGLDVAGLSVSGHLCVQCAKLFRRFIQNEAGFEDKGNKNGDSSE